MTGYYRNKITAIFIKRIVLNKKQTISNYLTATYLAEKH